MDDWCGQIADERETRRFKRGSFRVAFGRDTEDGTALAERQIQARLDDAATRLPSEIDDAHIGSFVWLWRSRPWIQPRTLSLSSVFTIKHNHQLFIYKTPAQLLRKGTSDVSVTLDLDLAG